MQESAHHPYEFGQFHLDPKERRLLRDGQPVSLTPKAFDTLLILVEQAGKLVAKEELMNALWPDSFVEEGTLNQNIWTVRKALGEAENGQRYIETVPRKGFRFVGEVMRQPEESTAETGAEVKPKPSRRKTRTIAITVIAGALVAAIWLAWPPRTRRPSLASFQTMTVTRVTSTGKTTDAAISPDGKYAAYLIDNDGQQSLWLRHIPTNTDKEIVAPAHLRHRGLIFSRDGNYLFFIGSDEKSEESLYQVTVLGGDMRKVTRNSGTEDISGLMQAGSIALSPDNTRLAYARRPRNGESALIIINIDGSGERKLITRHLPERIGEPGWSPDGNTIVCSIANIAAGYSFTLAAVSVADGKERSLSAQKWWTVGRVSWLGDGSGLVLTAADRPFGLNQIWFISYPDAQARRITNDLIDYNNVSLTSDSSTLLAIQHHRQDNVWLAPEGHSDRAKQITSWDTSVDDISWTPDNRILYRSAETGKSAVWIIDVDGKNHKQLTGAGELSQFPSASRDGRYIVFFAYNGDAFNVWRSDADGGNLKQLTNDQAHFPVISPDGKWVIYYVLNPTGGQIRKVSIDGGSPANITDVGINAIHPRISPDGKMILCQYASPDHRPSTPGAVFLTAVIPFAGGEPIKTFATGGDGWMADSRAFTFTITRAGVSNIWMQPLDGGALKQVTDFKSDQIFSYNWSFDGKQLALARGNTTSDAIMIGDLR